MQPFWLKQHHWENFDFDLAISTFGFSIVVLSVEFIGLVTWPINFRQRILD